MFHVGIVSERGQVIMLLPTVCLHHMFHIGRESERECVNMTDNMLYLRRYLSISNVTCCSREKEGEGARERTC